LLIWFVCTKYSSRLCGHSLCLNTDVFSRHLELRHRSLKLWTGRRMFERRPTRPARYAYILLGTRRRPSKLSIPGGWANDLRYTYIFKYILNRGWAWRTVASACRCPPCVPPKQPNFTLFTCEKLSFCARDGAKGMRVWMVAPAPQILFKSKFKFEFVYYLQKYSDLTYM